MSKTSTDITVNSNNHVISKNTLNTINNPWDSRHHTTNVQSNNFPINLSINQREDPLGNFVQAWILNPISATSKFVNNTLSYFNSATKFPEVGATTPKQNKNVPNQEELKELSSKIDKVFSFISLGVNSVKEIENLRKTTINNINNVKRFAARSSDNFNLVNNAIEKGLCFRMEESFSSLKGINSEEKRDVENKQNYFFDRYMSGYTFVGAHDLKSIDNVFNNIDLDNRIHATIFIKNIQTPGKIGFKPGWAIAAQQNDGDLKDLWSILDVCWNLAATSPENRKLLEEFFKQVKQIAVAPNTQKSGFDKDTQTLTITEKTTTKELQNICLQALNYQHEKKTTGTSYVEKEKERIKNRDKVREL